MSENAKYGLIVSFEDQSAAYVHGYEAGKIWERMRSGAHAAIEACVHAENKETLTRMAVADGWEIEFTPTEVEGWISMEMTKKKKAPDRPNPLGLRVVN